MLLKYGPSSQLVRIFAQHVDLDSAIRHSGSLPQAQEVSLSLLGSQPLDVTPTFREENFNLKSVCLVKFPEGGEDSTTGSDEGLCLFLYQVRRGPECS